MNEKDNFLILYLWSVYLKNVGKNPKTQIGSFGVLEGGVYTIVITNSEKVKLFQLTHESSIHIFWQLPQYILITLGETFFSVTGLEFSYTQVCFV